MRIAKYRTISAARAAVREGNVIEGLASIGIILRAEPHNITHGQTLRREMATSATADAGLSGPARRKAIDAAAKMIGIGSQARTSYIDSIVDEVTD